VAELQARGGDRPGPPAPAPVGVHALLRQLEVKQASIKRANTEQPRTNNRLARGSGDSSPLLHLGRTEDKEL
jgi:hypothetical protein